MNKREAILCVEKRNYDIKKINNNGRGNQDR